MNILISGHTGFVGINLVCYLKEHIPNVYIKHIVRTIKDVDLDILWDDLNMNSLKGFDIVIHLAGIAHDTNNVKLESEYFSTNLHLTKKLLDLFNISDTNKFIFISSIKAVAENSKNILMDDAIPNPKSSYGKSKLAAEYCILENKIENKEYYILRPCMIHGPGNKGNLNLLYSFSKSGLPYPLASFQNKRSFLSIDNLSYVISAICSKNVPSGIYNVSDDDPISTNDVIKIMGKVQNKNIRLLKLPKFLIISIAKVGDIFKLPLNTQRLDKLTENYVISNEKIKDLLGINKMPVSSYDGIVKTIKSFVHKN